MRFTIPDGLSPVLAVHADGFFNRALFCRRESGAPERLIAQCAAFTPDILGQVELQAGQAAALLLAERDSGAARPERMATLLSRFAGGGAPLGSLLESTAPDLLRLGAIQRINGFWTQDEAFAFVSGMAALAPVGARSRREGVLLVQAGEKRTRAALLYNERMPAFMELETARVLPGPEAADAFAALADDFRLGWVPPEKAAALGGFSWRASELPAEAEGFRPAFICGAAAGRLAAYGAHPFAKSRDEARDEAYLHCYGLLHTLGLQP